MKPLKDIGMSVHWGGMQETSPCGGLLHVQESPMLPNVPHYTLMSDQDRRELVRAVWDAALQSVMRIDDPYDDAGRCEEFLKSEGL